MAPRTRSRAPSALKQTDPADIKDKMNNEDSPATADIQRANETVTSTVDTSTSTKSQEQAEISVQARTEQSKAWKRVLESTSERPAKKARTTKTPAVPDAENNLKDSVRPDLILISIGLNPGIMTGKLGHAYAHPSNRYWPCLFLSGITPIQHKPEETFKLMDLYGIGHTNIIPDKATIGGNDLTKEDYMDGAKVLDQKIRELRPQAVMIVGKGIWEAWFQYKVGRKMSKKDGFEYGWQNEKMNIGRKNGVWDGAKTFVVTTTSGLSSQHTTAERTAIWKPMGDWFTPKREQWIKHRDAEEVDVGEDEQ